MKKIIAVICALLVAVSFFGCGGRLEGGQPGGEVVSNGGIALAQGDWIYFINGSMPDKAAEATTESPRAQIYRMKADGTDISPVSDLKAFNMYISGERIFYVTPTMKNDVLYCINIDGTQNKKLYTFDEEEYIGYGEGGVAVAHGTQIVYFDYDKLEKKEFEIGYAVSGLAISDSYIYFYAQNKSGTKAIDISSGSIETLCEDCGPFLYADDEMVYFVSARVPYRLNANTLECTAISEALYKNTLLNYKNSAIISIASSDDDEGVYMQPMENTGGEKVGEGFNRARIKIFTKAISAYCINDDYVFVCEEETGDIYRMNYDGTNKLVLGNVLSVYNVDSMDVVGNLLFIFDDVESGKAYCVPVDGSGSVNLVVKE